MASKSVSTIEENEQLVRRAVEELGNKGNVDAVDELFTEDVIDHFPFGETEGRDGIKEHTAAYHAGFADLSVIIEDMAVTENTVAMRLTQRGTHDGEFMGIEPTGREFEIGAMVFIRIENGRIAERWVQGDFLGLMQQLGVVDSPAQ